MCNSVEQHGNNPEENIIAVIPARYHSTRLEGKLLLPLNGKPLILHTIEKARKARNINRVIVATDHEKIFDVVRENGFEAVKTSPDHQSGSDRIAEVAENLPANSIIVNVQGDEPLISPRIIERAIEAVVRDETVSVATTCEPIYFTNDVLSSDVVKVTMDKNGFALYFSRSPIPFPRESVKKYGTLENALTNEKKLLSLFRKHTGLYVYRREFLLNYTKEIQTNLEKTELLEQLRILENGAKIKVVEVSESSIGVDTVEDYERVKEILENPTINYRKATVEDAPEIAKVHVESWRKSFTGIVAEEFLDNLSIEKREIAFREGFSNSNYKMFVAETEKDGIVGFADFGKARKEVSGYDAELYAIYLLPEFQRKGIGGELLKLCQRQMVAEELTSMYLITLENSPFKSFYEKNGGKIVGEEKHFIGITEYQTITYGWKKLSEKYE
ncbi:MAG TPA: 3-deoxy-manno-octulosonate cytidylyltransferase [Pyrinomonadaceae bacterium]|jgi:3-deoxy-manno-octulosonate cytidylyltransferase (CMP-KDO synthetase)